MLAYSKHISCGTRKSKHCWCLYAINARIHILMHAEDSCFSQECLSPVKCAKLTQSIWTCWVVWIVYYLYGVLLLAANKTLCLLSVIGFANSAAARALFLLAAECDYREMDTWKVISTLHSDMGTRNAKNAPAAALRTSAQNNDKSVRRTLTCRLNAYRELIAKLILYIVFDHRDFLSSKCIAWEPQKCFAANTKICFGLHFLLAASIIDYMRWNVKNGLKTRLTNVVFRLVRSCSFFQVNQYLLPLQKRQFSL